MALSIFESLVLLFNAFIDDFLGRGLYYFSKGKVQLKLDTASRAACQFLEFAESWSGFVAAYIMLAFGMDRILSITLPHRFQKDRYIKATLLLYLGIMLAGAVLNAPIAARFRLMHEEQTTMKIWLAEFETITTVHLTIQKYKI
ncbi:unnamed protein product [Hymenolepis diminuta]|uniref:G_PROTEIN_RECEP_F1_2 domain-containing protein n=1 Tax=Hymenolepis diminuta TaxID=6216 RepID=A0A564YVP0_HYMDI|nr:unnamed protein product [Hymenolepis diminuta]